MNESLITGLVLSGIAVTIFSAEGRLRKTGLDKIAAVMRTVIAISAIVFLTIGLMQE